MLGIRRCEKAAALKRSLHGLEIIRLDEIKERGLHLRFGCRLGLAVDPKRQLRIAGHGRGAAAERGRFHTGNGGHRSLELAHGDANGIGRVAESGGIGEIEADQVAGIEAGIDAPKVSQAADHQAGAG